MPTVFLSYSHKDKPIADQIEHELLRTGYTVWRDVNAIQAGRPIPEEVGTALGMADYLVVLISKNAVESIWMRHELSIFTANPERFPRVIPLRCDGTPVTQFSQLLAAHRWVDLTGDFDAGIADVKKVLGPADPTHDVYSTTDFSRLEFAIDVALRAGSVVMRFFNSSLAPNKTLGSSKNPATLADKAAQEVVEAALAAHPEFRLDGFYGEETSARRRTILDEGYTWVVDPLDGTTNFSARIPIFCVAIGILRDRKPHIGVVYDPEVNEVHYAVNGHPASTWYVSRGEVSPLQVASQGIQTTEAVVATHISSRPQVADRLIGRLVAIERAVKQVRAFGSGQLALAYLASGRLNAFFQFSAKIWDQVAGIVLVKNAGGVVVDMATGGDWTPDTEDLLVTADPATANHLRMLLTGSVHEARGTA